MTTPTLIMTPSGIRFVIGETFRPEFALRVAESFGRYIRKGPVIVGGDTRVSHEMVKSAVISGLLACGIDVIDIGKAPTPTHQQMVRQFKAAGSMVITASHNPIEWNGIKLMNADGAFLSPAEFEEFLKFYEAPAGKLPHWDGLGTVTVYPTAIQDHVNLILSQLDVSAIRQAKLNVLIDANNGTGAIADPVLMDALGVSYKILNPEPNGRFHHKPEPVKENLTELADALQKGNYDIGFCQDPDADRLVILDERGRFIGEDYSLAFCVDYILSHSQVKNPVVVVNLSTSKVVEDIAIRHGAQLIQTKIGETHVSQGIREHHAVVGGEGNGGVIYPKIGWGRDSLVGIVIALKYLAESQKSVSEIESAYPRYVLLRDKVTLSDASQVAGLIAKVESVFPGMPVNRIDGSKIGLPNGWVHVRPSNTEPIVRIFIEMPSEAEGLAVHGKIRAVL